MKKSRGAASARTPAAAPAAGTRLSAGGAFALNACFVAGLLVLSQLSLLQQRPTVRASIVGAALFLLAWSGLLFGVLRRGQKVALEIVPRRQHYLQACQQGAVILYWGYYWREVYHAAPLIAAQLLFAYGFDSLLSWTHRRTFVLGFGPFPIIFSINLFFWFKDDWFYLQFAMVALGFLAKEFLRWTRDGVNTHIFNPSSFPLAVVSVLLLLTNASEMTWGFDVATTPSSTRPRCISRSFSSAMPGQYLFGVTPMTMAAVVTTFVFSAVYYAATGSLLLLRLACAHCRVPRHAPAVHRSGHVAAHRAGADRLRRALRADHRPAVQRAAARGDARVLRQAAAGAAAQPVRGAARPAGAVAPAPEHRSRGVGPGAAPAPASPGLHERVGDRLRRP